MYSKKLKVALMVATVFGVLMISLTYINGEVSGKKIDKELKPINKSASEKGITFTVGDVVKNGHEQIDIEYVIKTEREIVFEEVIEKPNVYINGKLINHRDTLRNKKVGKNEYRGVIEIMPKKELPNNYDVKFTLDVLLGQPGNWEIEFSL